MDFPISGMADVDFHNQQNLNDVSLEGEITGPTFTKSDDEFSTLDEPIRETVMRDVRAVGIKLWHVFYPKQSHTLLKEWDLWGPLILCTVMAMMLQSSPEKLDRMNDGGPEFAEVFLVYWLGAVVVTLNIKLLGGNISFFQSVCVLGYCVTPLSIALVVCRCVLLVDPQTTPLFVVRFVVVLLGFGWSTFASTAFLAECQPPNRKALTVYPIFVFYFVISWLIVSHTHM